eukprot:gene18004-36735_t
MYIHIENRARDILQKQLESDADYRKEAYNRLEERLLRMGENKLNRETDDEIKGIIKNLIESEMDHKLYRQRNNEKHNIITFAASKTGTSDMFSFLLDKRTEISWIYGPVKCTLLDLTDIESGDLEDRKKGHLGAIEWICRDSQLEKLGNSWITEIIERKWAITGQSPFLWYGFFTCVLTIVLTAILILAAVPVSISFSNAKVEFNASFNTIALDLLIVYAAVYFTYFIVADILQSRGLQFHWFGLRGQINGAGSYDKVCFYLMAALFLGFIFAKLRNDNVPTKVLLSLCVMMGWIHLYFFLMGFESSGRFVMMIYKIVTGDLLRFLRVFSILLFGFSTAFFLMTEDENDSGFNYFGTVIFNLLQYTLNQNLLYFDLNDYKNDHAWMLSGLLIIYNILVTILMLNLIIAMM